MKINSGKSDTTTIASRAAKNVLKNPFIKQQKISIILQRYVFYAKESVSLYINFSLPRAKNNPSGGVCGKQKKTKKI